MDSSAIKQDSLDIINNAIRNKLIYYSSQNAQMITDANIMPNMVIAGDSLFRIYSWKQNDWDPVSTYYNVFQFKAGGKLYTLDNYDYTTGRPIATGLYYSKIYTLKERGKTIYLTISRSIPSNGLGSQWIDLYSIAGHHLDDTLHLIKMAGGMKNGLGLVINHTKLGSPVPDYIKYDPAQKTIYMAIFSVDGKFTGQYARFHFNGKYFEELPMDKEDK